MRRRPLPGRLRPHTLIEGTFAAHVGGVGAYVYLNDMLYLEATAYKTLDFKQQNAVGTDPFGAPGLFDGAAPYWRAAFEPHWGNNYLMVGTFGMMANVHPWIDAVLRVGNDRHFPANRQIHRRRIRYAVSISGRATIGSRCAAATFANTKISPRALRMVSRPIRTISSAPFACRLRPLLAATTDSY